ncbi:RNA-directed DNA polymerase, eukaryota, reverse transcriptase zinc-binding domain protein [Tanacetum coccineum]
MERGFLSQKGSGGRRGVKEKNTVVVAKSPCVFDEPVVKEKANSSTILFSFQFSFMDGLDSMLENGQWFILWVKLHSVLVTAFSEDGVSVIATKLGTPLMLDSYTSGMCTQSWGRSSYARAMIELRADVELKVNIVVAMAKISGEGHYICNIRVEYEWKPPRCMSCKIFRHIHEECLKNTGAKGEEPTIEVSNLNPFEVLNSVNNDVELGTNGGTIILVNNGANSSGSSFMNVDNSSPSTTPIMDKIGKFEDLLTSGQAILVDEAGNPLKKVEFLCDFNSEDEHSMFVGQWRNSYGNGDYDEDPYDDDMYEGQDLPQEIQAICDNLDIQVRVEGLHNAFADAVDNGLMSSININNSSINISHLFFADDVIITTGWNARDLENIIRVLNIFYLASGLKINIHKSNIYGIGVNEDEVYNMASNAGCILGNIPFIYLGLPIGSNMKSIACWKMLIDHFHSRLSTWKASLLSIGGNMTLIKSVLGSLGIYYLSIFRAPASVLNDLERIRSNLFWGGNQDGKKMAWVKWSIILNSYDNGGLNIGSLKAFNLALLQKWRWRLFTSPNDLWVKVVKAFHGHEGGFDNNGCSFKGTWANIVESLKFLHSKGIILNNSFRFNAGCGTHNRFWNDIWVGEALSLSGPILNLGPNGTFTVKDARNIIDQKTLPSTSWDKIIPRKVNIFMWRLSLDRLPHRLNLSLRGMDIPAISCSSCNANVESANHIFFECIIASDLWKLVYRCYEIPFVQALSFEAFKDWLSSWHAPKEKKHRIFIISTSRQFDFILDGLAEVPSNDRVIGQWLNALFQKDFLSRLLPRGLFGVSLKTTSE